MTTLIFPQQAHFRSHLQQYLKVIPVYPNYPFTEILSCVSKWLCLIFLECNDEIESIQDLLQAVKDIGDWKGLCTTLGVEEGVMTSPETKKQDCLTAYWNNGEATWTEVVRAVADNNKRIAKKIAKKYCVDFDKVINER